MNEKTFTCNGWIDFTYIFLLIADFKNCCCSKSWNLYLFLFLAECYFSTLINYPTNMCWTSYEPTVVIVSRKFISMKWSMSTWLHDCQGWLTSPHVMHFLLLAVNERPFWLCFNNTLASSIPNLISSDGSLIYIQIFFRVHIGRRLEI